MEFKIKLLAKLLAMAAGVLCLMLTIDEILPTTETNETVLNKIEDRFEEGTNLHIDFYIETNTHRKMEVEIEKYVQISENDDLNLFITPIFHQLKAYHSISRKTGEVTEIGNPDLPRELPFIMGLIVTVLAVFVVFVIKRFELKVALAFLTLVVTAVRWWFIGI